MGVINMAHGEMVMLGAYTTFVVQEIIRTSAPHLFDVSLVIALPLAFVVRAPIGILIERTIIRFLYGRPLDTLLATWGLSLVLQQAGALDLRLVQPRGRLAVVDVGHLPARPAQHHLRATLDRGVRADGLRSLILLLRKTPLGLYMRAVTQNRPMAAAVGIARRGSMR
jgi:urea transport system permease protein